MPGRSVPWQRLAAVRLLEQDSAHQRTVYRCRRFPPVTEPICHRSTAEPKRERRFKTQSLSDVAATG